MPAAVVPTEEPPAVVPATVESAPQSTVASAYPFLSCSPRHLGLIPSAVAESEPTEPSVGLVVVATIPMAKAPVSAPASPSLLDLCTEETDVQSNKPGMQASSLHLLPLVGSPTVLLPNFGYLSISVLGPSEEAILAPHLSAA